MIDKSLSIKLQEINLIVIDLIRKYHKVDITNVNKYWYEIIINFDGSLRLGFKGSIMANDTNIQCKSLEDFESVKDILKYRLNE